MQIGCENWFKYTILIRLKFRVQNFSNSKANADWLYESIGQMKTGKSFPKELIEE